MVARKDASPPEYEHCNSKAQPGYHSKTGNAVVECPLSSRTRGRKQLMHGELKEIHLCKQASNKRTNRSRKAASMRQASRSTA